ncbi:ABC transporter permease [Leucobacter rhizosphaerae]|uniref:ABC transporter permease n=1 Tax=Leucobacter rhizosphaerae TaxID=2932245 RepID=A0ABY4FS32_9MICO|nr:ABC transporter permease [Leucobacter rhizosphaerae]UOQ59078.1 ABC transporter permease [Leucobacter rhizosphaerae]
MRFIRTTAEKCWLVVVLVLLWWFTSAGSENVFFPPLATILETLWRDLANGLLIGYLGFSLGNLLLGLTFAIVIGVALGLLIGEIRWLREALDPFVNFARSVPQAALVPLIVGTFGLGPGPKIYTIAFACVFPILLNTIDGVRGIEPTIRRFGKVYRIPPARYFRRVVLPGALPQIFAGIRVALPIGITVMVVSELFAANRGVGFYILNSSSTFQMAQTWAGAVLVGIIGYAITLIFSRIERIPLRWYFTSGAMAK